MTYLIGHSKNWNHFITLCRRSYVPHAFILKGNEGIGKACMAKSMLSTLCTQAWDDPPVFDEQPSHSEWITLSPIGNAKKITVEQIRQLRETLSSKPVQAVRGVFIDPADALTYSATNALLKTLEDPVLYTLYFFLITHRYHISPTLLSRCFPLKMQSLSREEFSMVLKGHNIEEEEQNLLYPLIYGSPGIALNLKKHGFFSLYHQMKGGTTLSLSSIEPYIHDGYAGFSAFSFACLCFLYEEFKKTHHKKILDVYEKVTTLHQYFHEEMTVPNTSVFNHTLRFMSFL